MTEPTLTPVPAATRGEDATVTGDDGVELAKNWLDRSTRCRNIFTIQNRSLRDLLCFPWPTHTKTYSFDMGGEFRGDDLEGQTFLAEVKNYKKELDLPTHFRAFLAKCYLALGYRPDSCDNFLWISWAPFQAQSWDSHCSYDKVVASLLHDSIRPRIFGDSDKDAASSQIDPQQASQVAERIWLITLSHRQDRFHILDEHYRKLLSEVAS